MPVITGAIADPVTITGLDGVVYSRLTGELADPVQIWGNPGTTILPAPTPSASPDAVKARMLDEDGAFICPLPHAQGLTWLDEHNSAGGGSIEPSRYDDLETEHPNVWDAGNQVMISVGGRDIFRLVLDAEGGYRIDDTTGQRIDTWSGVGALGVLNSGMIEPEYGWRPEATDERSFDYGSNPAIGGWFVPSEWKTPVGKLVRKSIRWTYKRRHLPKGWPDKKAQWLWWKNPDTKSVPDETCYLISSYTLAARSRMKFWACGDDILELQIDGEIRATAGPGGWKSPTKIVMYQSAGLHRIAAKVTNTPATDGASNRSGFLCSVARVQGDGDIIAWVRRTRPDKWLIRRQRSGAPGWFPAQILYQLVVEQINRGCAGHAGITFGFTPNLDSHGISWTTRRELGLPVGDFGLDWLQKIVETGLVDVAMTPNLRLNAWRQRGTDRSRTVRLDQGSGRKLGESAPQTPTPRNVLYGRSKTGWAGTSDAASVISRGRREAIVTLGSARSTTATGVAINAMLPDMANPPQTTEVKLSGVKGPQPYRDFDVADWVSLKPAGATTWGRVRVMSIAGEVDPNGYPIWTLQCYEDPA